MIRKKYELNQIEMLDKICFGELYLEPSKNGLTRPTSVRGSGYKMINMNEVFAHNRIKALDMELVQLNKSEIENYSVRKGDLLFARQSLVVEGAGKCSIVSEVPEITTFESHLIRVRLNTKIAMPEFYYYYFLSTIGKAQIQTIVMQVAAAGIRGADLARLTVPFPPLPTQQKIASVLSAYDDLIENNNRRIAILEKMAQSIYNEWFVRMRFPGYQNAEFVDGLPKGWGNKSLNEVANFTMGQSPSSEYYNEKGEGLPFHQGVTNFGGRFPSHQTYCSVDGRIAEKGDILFSVRAPVGRLNIANNKLILGRGLSAIRHKQNLQSFLFYQLQYCFRNEDIIGNGAIFNAVTKNEMEKIEIVVPDNGFDLKFNEIVQPIDEEIEILSRKNINLRKTRDLLLPRLITGKLSADSIELNAEV